MKINVFRFHVIKENTNYAFVIVIVIDKIISFKYPYLFLFHLQVNCGIQILTKWLNIDRVGQLVIELH